jgi:hypothetical protein
MLSNLLLTNPPTPSETTYVEDVFSTYLYTGNAGTQTINNGIDFTGQGAMVWFKSRSATTSNALYDTVRGAKNELYSNTTAAATTLGGVNGLTAFTSSGFTLSRAGTGGDTINANNGLFCSWTFRKAARFFDVVTWTGTGSNRTISHALGQAPGLILVKRRDTTADWQVYHNTLANTEYLVLNSTATKATGTTRWNSTTATATEFSIGTDASVNASGGTYVAYLFAHDTTADGIVQCGSYTGNGSATGPFISLGWQPQYVLIKSSSNALNWHIVDVMRGMTVDQGSTLLYPNLTNADGVAPGISITPTPTGFQVNTVSTSVNTSGATYIYMAIRSGPMRVPTDATKVFEVISRLGNATDPTVVGSSVLTDMALIKNVTSTTTSTVAVDRLRGTPYLLTTGQAAENTTITNVVNTTAWATMTGIRLAGGAANSNNLTNGTSVNNYVNYLFRRARSFFDVVTYTGTGSVRTVSHNLGVAPELLIVRSRDAGKDWHVYAAPLGNNKSFVLNENYLSGNSVLWNNTTPTSSTFSVAASVLVNQSGEGYVAYLFASCPGVSKVGSYAGNGTSINIDCGFTNGARFILIKRTDLGGDWYVWDSARGIIAANDPYYILNATAAHVTNNDTLDPLSTGFTVNQVAATNVNVSGAAYIYLAIA